MKILINIDKFSGHLFHDIELYISLFYKINNLNNSDINSIYFYKDENIKNTKFYTNNSHKINNFICNKLFGCDFKHLETIDKEHFDLIINRNQENNKKINKAFSDYIINFPTDDWIHKISNHIPDKNFKILYASRQNTSRCLSDKSHNNIKNIVSYYKGTTIDDFSNYTIEEQINIFRQHNCLIGVHGNNLSGIMWMNKKSHIYEILPYKEKYKVYDYHCMSLCMKSYYTQIDCQGDLNSKMNIKDKDLEYLKQHLHLIHNLYNDDTKEYDSTNNESDDSTNNKSNNLNIIIGLTLGIGLPIIILILYMIVTKK